MYLEQETEEEVKHGDDADAEIKYEEMLLAAGAIEETQAQAEARLAKEAVKKATQKTKMVMILCSCGSPKCWAINRFGLRAPLFHQEIEPIYSQYERDMKAARMKVLGA